MPSVSVSVKIERKGADLEKRLKQIKDALAKGPTKVKVGFPAGKAPGDVIAYAFYNHEGTNRAKGDVFFKNGKFGISGPIPPRPFITVAMFKGRGAIRMHLRAEAKAIFNGKADLKASLTRVGMLGQDLIQTQIGSNMGPANSPMTIELKGSSKTLVDSGRMLGSVTWDFDK